MYYAMRASAPSLHRESTDSLISVYVLCTSATATQVGVFADDDNVDGSLGTDEGVLRRLTCIIIIHNSTCVIHMHD